MDCKNLENDVPAPPSLTVCPIIDALPIGGSDVVLSDPDWVGPAGTHVEQSDWLSFSKSIRKNTSLWRKLRLAYNVRSSSCLTSALTLPESNCCLRSYKAAITSL
eukprot:CAMPEP_0204255178 /NCGR_PEP_ID=MMETSP0468-20130131/3051_1 /ASSEMBLY_ACC=CAM_ASM_000383 /TAXON_ID=2969 /ORGANISM="Oxyrrhis marina" /LENGTH=104 /DNA_ID=CAMNT_0051229033 /DNA_START=390 /DNA_END=700 /DNA_ORIENTATION=+